MLFIFSYVSWNVKPLFENCSLFYDTRLSDTVCVFCCILHPTHIEVFDRSIRYGKWALSEKKPRRSLFSVQFRTLLDMPNQKVCFCMCLCACNMCSHPPRSCLHEALEETGKVSYHSLLMSLAKHETINLMIGKYSPCHYYMPTIVIPTVSYRSIGAASEPCAVTFIYSTVQYVGTQIRVA